MNLFVADPHWGWWIILYFFLGGIAAGAYFTSTLIELVGKEEDRPIARVGYLIALPLISICGLFLIVDLNHPWRFWHMLIDSETGMPQIKLGSPMSIGSWALSLFGLCSFISFVASVRPRGMVARWHRSRMFGRPLRVVGCAVGFFVASYTGALLTATNQPIWSDTTWIASLFLASAASTGIAAMILLGRKQATTATLVRLERADRWVLILEFVVFVIFLASLGSFLLPLAGTLAGKVLIGGTLLFGLVVPLAIHFRFGLRGHLATATAVSVLFGGFLLRWAILSTPPELLAGG